MLHTCDTFGYHPRVMFNAKNSIRVAVGKTKLDGCIVLNEHNKVFASNRPAVWNWCFPGHTRVLDANGISIVLAVFPGSLGDRSTDHTTRPVTLGGAHSGEIKFCYCLRLQQVFIGAVDSTDRINFSNQQLYSAVRLDGLHCMWRQCNRGL